MNLKALAYQLREDTINIICAGKAGHIGGDMSVMEVLVELYFDQILQQVWIKIYRPPE